MFVVMGFIILLLLEWECVEGFGYILRWLWMLIIFGVIYFFWLLMVWILFGIDNVLLILIILLLVKYIIFLFILLLMLLSIVILVINVGLFVSGV